MKQRHVIIVLLVGGICILVLTTPGVWTWQRASRHSIPLHAGLGNYPHIFNLFHRYSLINAHLVLPDATYVFKGSMVDFPAPLTASIRSRPESQRPVLAAISVPPPNLHTCASRSSSG